MYQKAIERNIPLDEMPLIARHVGGVVVKKEPTVEIEMLMEKWDITRVQASNLRHFAIRNGKTAYEIEPVQARLSAKAPGRVCRARRKDVEKIGLYWKDPDYGWRINTEAYMQQILAGKI